MTEERSIVGKKCAVSEIADATRKLKPRGHDRAERKKKLRGIKKLFSISGHVEIGRLHKQVVVFSFECASWSGQKVSHLSQKIVKYSVLLLILCVA